jgi:hypothetical protein
MGSRRTHDDRPKRLREERLSETELARPRRSGWTSPPGAGDCTAWRDPATAPHVQWIFAQRLAGQSVNSIARAINEKGVPCPSGADPDRTRARILGPRDAD